MPTKIDKDSHEISFTPSNDGSHDNFGASKEVRDHETNQPENDFNTPEYDRNKDSVNDDIASAENDFDSRAEQDENDQDQFFKNEQTEKSGFRYYINKLKATVKSNPKKSGGLGLGILGLGMAGYIGIISLGPLEIIHMSQNLQNLYMSDTENANNVTATKLFYYAKSKGDFGRTRLGVWGNTNADIIDKELKKSGVTIKSANAKAGFTVIIDPTDGLNALEKAEGKNEKAKQRAIDKQNNTVLKSLQNDGFNAKIEKGVVLIESNGKFFNYKSNIKLIKYIFGSTTNWGKVATAVHTRNTAKKVGISRLNFPAMVDNEIAKKRNDAIEKLWKNLGQRLTGQSSIAEATGAPVEDKNLTDEERANKQSSNDQAAKEANDAAEKAKSSKSFKSFIKPGGAGLAAGGAGLICIVKHAASDVDNTNSLRARASVMAVSATILPVGNEAQAGSNIDYRGLGEISKLLHTDPEIKKQLQKEGKIAYENSNIENYQASLSKDKKIGIGAKLDGSANPNPSQSELGKTLDSIPGLDEVCGVMENTVVQIASFAVAPFASAATMGAIVVAEPVITDFFKNDAVDFRQKEFWGGPFKEALHMGTFLMGRETAISAGGVASSAEAAKIHQINEEYTKQNKTIADKYLDIYNPNSILGNIAKTTYQDNSNLAVLKTPINLFGNIANIFDKKASAQNPPFYDVEPATIPENVLSSDENPYQISEEVRQLLVSSEGEKYKGEEGLIRKCHGVEVIANDSDLDFMNIEGDAESPALVKDKDLRENPECSDVNDPNMRKIRIAMNALFVAKGLCASPAFQDNNKEDCEEIIPDTSGSGDVPATLGECPKNPKVFPEPDGKLKPDTILVGRCTAIMWPQIQTIGSWRADGGPVTDHPDGEAVDIMMPGGCVTPGSNSKDEELGNEISKYYQENAKAFGVKYMIWKQRIWNVENNDPVGQWRGMSGRGNCTDDHMDHVHITTFGNKATGIPGGDFATIDKNLFASSVGIDCASGTKDAGIEDGYHENKKVKIRLCEVNSIKGKPGYEKILVNSRVSESFEAMGKAAKKDGVTIVAGENFRTMKEQEYYYNCFITQSCNEGRKAAPPGTSNHQMGLALDVSEGIDWLGNNGKEFGVSAKVSGEPWHWSVGGY